MNAGKIKVFVSSVQKELEAERVSVAGAVSSDSQLSAACEVVLFDKEPLSGKRIKKPYLDSLADCNIYLLILNCEYGRIQDTISATHEEYRFAKERDMPMLVFVQGKDDAKREKQTQDFLDEIKKDDNTYRRFHDRLDLKPGIKDALKRILSETFDIDIAQVKEAEAAVDMASGFEHRSLDISADELDLDIANTWLVARKEVDAGHDLPQQELLNLLRQKGLVRLEEDQFKTQASGLLFFGKDPSLHFPQCRILIDAFRTTIEESNRADEKTLSGPAPALVEQVWDFVQQNTRHPMRVVGLNRISLDEYPQEAVREAVVNAIAHRNYDDSARQILIKLFSDRLEVLSPGTLMKPLTVGKITKGKYLPCSRNPMLGQYLNHLRLMDQRGSGIGRMKDAMLNHGLEPPKYDEPEGYFRVTLYGPGDNLDRLRSPSVVSAGIPPAIADRLNKRQKAALQEVLESGSVSSGWLVKTEKVAYDTANRDLIGLADLNILVRQGKGRATKYVLADTEPRK